MAEFYFGAERPTTIPLHRVSVLRPFAAYLESLGAPVQREFRQARLPYGALEDADNYVPSDRFRAFVVSAAQQEGIETLGFQVGRKFGANCADPNMRQRLRGSPTMFRGLTMASELVNRTVYNSRMGLSPTRHEGPMCLCHLPSSSDPRNAATAQIGWFGVMTMIGFIRVFAGPKWLPAEIGILGGSVPGRGIREFFPDTRIQLNNPCSYVSLDGLFLGMQPASAHATDATRSQEEPVSVPHDFAGALARVLASYVLDSKLDLNVAAALCGLSKRSLQRRLSESGINFSEALARARYDAATRLLMEPGRPVADIATRLGYSDPANFSRAFRRWSGYSPRAFRLVRTDERNLASGYAVSH